jgi:hypothetical protein
VSAPWTVRIGDQVVAEKSITGGEAVDMARIAGRGWASLDPLDSPLSLCAIVAVLRSTRLGEELDEAIGAVADIPAAELLALVQVEEEPASPLPG